MILKVVEEEKKGKKRLLPLLFFCSFLPAATTMRTLTRAALGLVGAGVAAAAAMRTAAQAPKDTQGHAQPQAASPSLFAPPPPPPAARSILDAIGNTPLIELRSLSKATGCKIYAKAEYMNPGGSVKDRPAREIILSAERNGTLKPGGVIVEGTGGNTGVGMALIAAALGYKAIFTVPSGISQEKIDFARALGAEVVVCPLVPFSSKEHYYHRAREIAASTPNALWGNQFENLSNSDAH